MTYVESLSQLRAAAKAAEDRKGDDIIAFDVRGQSSITDSFLFVSGTSHIHIRAIEDSIREELKKAGAVLSRTDGQRGHVWRALDYGSFIIHIMDKKTRDFYAMERLWERAKPIALNLNTPAPVIVKTKKPAKKKPVRKPAKKTSRRRPPARRKR
jgi:ribosome-associated protein